jgi:tripartite-type tricarboxylate transporter receptor subunit TctC
MMRLPLRRILSTLLAAAFAHAGSGAAQSYPSKPLRLIVPFAPGGGIDTIGRIVAQKLSEPLGQPVVVENRAGAGGLIGFESILKAPADGYTLGVGTISTLAVIPVTQAKPSYDPLKDFAPVTHPSLPARSPGELVKLAQSKPGSIIYGSSGYASGTHLTAEYFSAMAGVKMVHVPYKGDGPAVIDLMAGQISIGFFTMIIMVQHIRSGRLRALAVTSAARSRELPQVPTIAESGYPELESQSWQGIAVRAGTPAAIVRRLNSELVRILNNPEVRASIESQGNDVAPGTPEEFERFIAKEISKWRRVITTARIRID